MKRVILAGIALAMVSVMGAANAADMPRRQAAMPAKAPAFAPVYNWTGFYLGINGGGGWGTSNWSSPVGSTGNFDVSGGVVGGTAGYNWQMGQTVFGLEGDLDWSNISGSSNAAVCGTTCETNNNWLGTVRGRIGYAFDRFMPYITGGLAVGDIEGNLVGGGSTTKTKAGWTLGGGLEFAIAGPWTAKVEYLYVDLGDGRCDTCLGGADVSLTTNLVRGGINYRF